MRALPVGLQTVKLKDLAKHVDLMAEGLRTRVRSMVAFIRKGKVKTGLTSVKPNTKYVFILLRQYRGVGRGLTSGLPCRDL